MFENFAWTCPFCHRDTTIVESSYSVNTHSYYRDMSSVKEGVELKTTIIACPNPDCNEYMVEASMSRAWHAPDLNESQEDYCKELVFTLQLHPSSSAIPQPEYIPLPIREDYEEACAIVELSPKAAATLARRCLQGMIRDFWGIKEKNLQNEIDQLKGKVENSTWNSIDAVRKLGNIGAHMKKNVNLIVNIEPEEAEALIKLIEYLFRTWYVARHEREEQDALLLKIVEEKESLKSKPSG